MKDAHGIILYIGKALNLRNRVSSYLLSEIRLTPKTVKLMQSVTDIEYFITGTEEEALVLELNLIKQHRPQYNINLKDDKNLPYLKIQLQEEWPRVIVTRHLEPDGALYFGPFGSAQSIRRTLDAVKRIFPFRSCKKIQHNYGGRACLEYDLGRCLSPCTGHVSKTEYDEVIRSLVLFLDGRYKAVLKDLKSAMKVAAQNMLYEKAARIRDQIKHISDFITYHEMAIRTPGDVDILGMSRNDNSAYIQVLFIRSGRLVGREGFLLNNTSLEPDSYVLSSFVKQYYNSASVIPPKIFLPNDIDDKSVVTQWLSTRRHMTVAFTIPRKGTGANLVRIAVMNAFQNLGGLTLAKIPEIERAETSLKELAKVLKLPDKPVRIEGYDISNIQGRNSVGSMVVFINGLPSKTHYRRFKIRCIDTPDDYSMLEEVIRRRFSRNSKPQASNWCANPDFILIDGGKGQLNAVCNTLDSIGIDNIFTVSLAKANEEVFLPGRSEPVKMESFPHALCLLQAIRDESHRFALGYHHKLRRQAVKESSLDSVPGIGLKRKQLLISQFGSAKAVRAAATDRLLAVKGITPSIVRAIKELD